MTFLIYAVCTVVILMTLHAGYLGWKFYFNEIIRKE